MRLLTAASRFEAVRPLTLATMPRTFPVTEPTAPVTAAAVGVAAVAAVVTLVFIVAVRSPFVGAFVRFVTVVIVPAVIFVVLAGTAGMRFVCALMPEV